MLESNMKNFVLHCTGQKDSSSHSSLIVSTVLCISDQMRKLKDFFAKPVAHVNVGSMEAQTCSLPLMSSAFLIRVSYCMWPYNRIGMIFEELPPVWKTSPLMVTKLHILIMWVVIVFEAESKWDIYCKDSISLIIFNLLVWFKLILFSDVSAMFFINLQGWKTHWRLNSALTLSLLWPEE